MNLTLSDLIKTNYNSSAPAVRVIESGQGAYLTIDGHKLLNLCSSHYLGLAVNKRIQDAVKQAVEKHGIGTGYRTLAGTHRLHVELEEALARFKGTEAAIVLTGGYMANCAAIQTIIGKEDIVISDELNHASIIDAVRLSGVKNKYIYKHRNVNDLKTQLFNIKSLLETANEVGSKRLCLIITDGVFSMDGDLAPLPEIVELAQKHGAITMVDDAHGEGVLGKGGRGIVNHFNLHGKVDIEVGTLSKAFSVMGGFITGSRQLINFYKQKSRQFLFSNALTIADAAAALEGVKILSESDAIVQKLWDNTKFLKSSLRQLGFDTGLSETPITPIMLKEENLAVKFAAELFSEGIFATSIRFPMVARRAARVRLIPSAAHSRQDLQMAIDKIEKVGRKLAVI